MPRRAERTAPSQPQKQHALLVPACIIPGPPVGNISPVYAPEFQQRPRELHRSPSRNPFDRSKKTGVIITRTPLRISIGGGGTDLPSYYCRDGGFVLSAAIDKYIYV